MAKGFISQLKDIQNNFLKYAENKCKEFSDDIRVNKKTLEITICNQYLALRVETITSSKDVPVVFYQEVGMEPWTDKKYQKDLEPEDILTIQ